MKNVLVYLSPGRQFDEQSSKLLAVQLENSFDLGWKPEDILLVTNFEYQQDSVKASVIADKYFSAHSPISTKVSAMVGAFDHGLIGDDLYWLHDLDAFQEQAITEAEIGIADGPWDMALCPFGRLTKWSGGSIFFRKQAKDIFRLTFRWMRRRRLVDEIALTQLTQRHETIHNRIRRLNISYNFVPFNIKQCYALASKPLKVVHFNPFEGIPKLSIRNLLECYKGDNRIATPLITDRLLNIFIKHGVGDENC